MALEYHSELLANVTSITVSRPKLSNGCFGNLEEPEGPPEVAEYQNAGG